MHLWADLIWADLRTSSGLESSTLVGPLKFGAPKAPASGTAAINCDDLITVTT